MSEVLERVARHMAFADKGAAGDWKQYTVMAYAGLCALRDAGLCALRDPTKAMILAGETAKDDAIDEGYSSDMDGNRYDYTSIHSDAHIQIWRAMLESALKE